MSPVGAPHSILIGRFDAGNSGQSVAPAVDQARCNRPISASISGKSIRPFGLNVAMRVTLGAKSLKLPDQRAAGLMANER